MKKKYIKSAVIIYNVQPAAMLAGSETGNANESVTKSEYSYEPDKD